MFKLSKNTKYNLLIIFLLFILSIIYTRGILFPKGLVAGYDWSIAPEQGQLIRSFEESRYAWRTFGIFTGFPANPLWLSGNLQTLVNYLVAKAGISGELYSKISLLLIIFISGVSAYILLRHLKFKQIPSIISSIVYMSAPMFFNWLVMIGGFGIALVYALLPLIFYFFLKSVSSEYWIRYTIITTFLMINIYPVFGFAVSMIVIILYSSFSILLSDRRISDFKIYFRSILVISLFFFLLQSFWLVSAFFDASQAFAGMRLQNWVDVNFKLIDIIRLWGFHLPVYERMMNMNLLKIIASFSIPIISFSVFLLKKKPKEVWFFSFLVLGIVGFLMMPFSSSLIKKNIMFLGIFRDSSKLFTLISFGYLIMLAYFIDSILKRMKGRIKQGIFIFIFTLIVILYISPYLTGNFGGNSLYHNLYTENYGQVNEWLKKQKGDFKVLWLPTGVGYVKAHSPITESHIVDFYTIFSPRPGGITDIVNRYRLIPEFWLSNFFYDKKPHITYLGKILGLFNVKDLILRKGEIINNWCTVHKTTVWDRKTNDIIKNIEHQRDLYKIDSYGDIDIFRNKNHLPHIFAVKKMNCISGGLNTFISLSQMDDYLFKDNAFLFANQDSVELLSAKYSDIIISNGNVLDLILTLIPGKTDLAPGQFSTSQKAEDGWSMFHQWYWDMGSQQQSLDDGIYTISKGTCFQTDDFEIKEKQAYEIWVKFYYTGIEKSSLSLSLIKKEKEQSNCLFSTSVSTFSELERGFKWVKVAEQELAHGIYGLEIRNDYGENWVDRIVFIPKEKFISAYNFLSKFAEQKKVTYLFNLQEYIEN